MVDQKEHRLAKVGVAAFLLTALLVVATSSALAQQTYVTRFDSFAGYTFLDSPHIGLFENGFHYQIGVRPTTWYSLGFDYSISNGNLTLTPNLLTTKLQGELGALLGPAAAGLSVGAHSRTQTFAGGPQFAYRHFRTVTLFVRPSCGIIKELATAQPVGPLATGVVGALEAQGLLASSGKKSDWTPFYGVGYGIDFLVGHHFGLRVQSDLVHDHLFDDLLKDSRWTTRFSVGPLFNFGKNIVRNGALAKSAVN